MKHRPLLLCCGLAILANAIPSFAAALTAEIAFARLKSMEGIWEGRSEGFGEEAEAAVATAVKHEIRVSAAGSVVMETMNPATDHEMINMYHLDGDDLVLTHYCAGGNQPHMKLVPSRSTSDIYMFEFAGGTNLDAAVDPHIHAAEIRFLADDRIESSWQAWANGQQMSTMVFRLSRMP